jgi:hypothetical protein
VKRILSLAVLAFVVSAPSAYADSIPTLDINISYATAGMGPDGGVLFTLVGPGTTITGFGGMACSPWCSGPITDLSSVNAGQVFIGGFLNVTIAGISYNPDLLSLQCCLFSAFGDLGGTVSGFVGQDETFRLLTLTVPGGSWNFKFDSFPASNGNPPYFLFNSGSLTAGTPSARTPEPGTLGLMFTGLAGLAGMVRNKRLSLRRKCLPT